MKKTNRVIMLVLLSVAVLNFGGCMAPPLVEKIEEIETNETAFLVPLEGATKENQAQFMSLQYLEEAKVAAKRVVIPVRYRKTGRGWWMKEIIPTLRVIKVDRTPVTREWTKETASGTSSRDEAIAVESKDSIGFSVGVNLTAFVSESDASVFLYHFAGKPLEQVVDENVRGFVQTSLGANFGSRTLEDCKNEKAEIFKEIYPTAANHFKELGITINNLGHAEGLIYDDKEIQDAINRAFVAEMDIKVAQQEKLAQDPRNELMIAKATAEREAAEEFAKAQEALVAKTELEIRRTIAEATKTAASKWNGNTPASILPAGSNFLFGLDTTVTPKQINKEPEVTVFSTDY